MDLFFFLRFTRFFITVGCFSLLLWHPIGRLFLRTTVGNEAGERRKHTVDFFFFVRSIDRRRVVHPSIASGFFSFSFSFFISLRTSTRVSQKKTKHTIFLRLYLSSTYFYWCCFFLLFQNSIHSHLSFSAFFFLRHPLQFGHLYIFTQTTSDFIHMHMQFFSVYIQTLPLIK